MITDEIPENLPDQLRFYAKHVEELGAVKTDYGPGIRGTEALIAEGLTQAAWEIETLGAALAEQLEARKDDIDEIMALKTALKNLPPGAAHD